MRLRVVSEAGSGTEYPVPATGGAGLGRDPGCDAARPDPRASMLDATPSAGSVTGCSASVKPLPSSKRASCPLDPTRTTMPEWSAT